MFGQEYGFCIITVTLIWFVLVRRSVEQSTPCPTDCTCNIGRDSVSLDCYNRNRTVDDPIKISAEIDKLLSTVIVADITALKIVSTQLTWIPASVCRMHALTKLFVKQSPIEALPDNCFAQMSNLKYLTVCEGSLTYLQDGLFDGNQLITDLDFCHNYITSVGLSVFSRLPRLSSVTFFYNHIQSLEPWVLALGEHLVPDESEVHLGLESNNVSQFTNEMKFRFNLSAVVRPFSLYWQHNGIRHLSDMSRGWGIEPSVFARFIEIWTNNSSVLYGNPLICDCVDFDYYAVRERLGGTFKGVRCDSPPEMKGMNIMSVPLESFVCNITEQCPIGCLCVYRPATNTFHVNCFETQISQLPETLPALPKSDVKYKLHFSQCHSVRSIEDRDYFANATILEFSEGSLEDIELSALQHLLDMDTLFLHANLLRTLPINIQAINVSLTRLTLGLNPWTCSCENSWMIHWLLSVENVLLDADKILCETPSRFNGHHLIRLQAAELCGIDSATRVILLTVVPICCVLIVMTSVIMMCHRLRISLFVRWKFHPVDRDECAGEDMDYDVFLCCSSDDHRPHGVLIVDLLETHGYKVCYHVRDFACGESIEGNMNRAIERSKRTVCLVSQHFLNSSYCVREFEIAYNHCVNVLHKNRLLVLMMLDSPSTAINATIPDDSGSLSIESLRQHIDRYTYIDFKSDEWLHKLLYTLPIKPMQPEQRTVHQNSDNRVIVHIVDAADERTPLIRSVA